MASQERTTKLLALIDGSAYSKSVCDHVAWAAARMDAAVDIVHVLGRREAPEQRDLSGSIRLGARTALLEELSDLDERRSKLALTHGRAILDDAKSILDVAGVSPVQTHMRRGDLVEAISEMEISADLMVIGKRGEAADFAKLHLGSNLERIIRSANKPVMVTSRAFAPISRVVVAYDGGTSTLKAIDMVARSSLYAGLECHMVMVGSEESKSRTALAQAAATLKTGGHEAKLHSLPGSPETVLGGFVEPGDILVMGAYGHSRIRNMIIGSTTSEMIRTCKVPLVLVR